jgi:hypothetical protein
MNPVELPGNRVVGEVGWRFGGGCLNRGSCGRGGGDKLYNDLRVFAAPTAAKTPLN